MSGGCLKLVRKHKNLKPFKQLTLDNLLSETQQNSSEAKIKSTSSNVHAETPFFRSKQITIAQLVATNKDDDELAVDTDFRLVPSKKDFSKVRYTLWFDEQKAYSNLIEIPQSFVASDEFQLKLILDLKGVSSGSHSLKVELCDVFSPLCASKETTFEYKPQTKEDRLKRIPTVRKIEGFDISVVSNNEKDVFKEIDETFRKEQISKRDSW